MALSNLTLSTTALSIICSADAEFRPVYAYEGGERTDVQRTREDGAPIFAIRDQAITMGGQQIQATIETDRAITFNEGTIMRPAEEAEVRIRAVSGGGSFASLMVTVFVPADGWTGIEVPELIAPR